jgi:hypothetical protein
MILSEYSYSSFILENIILWYIKALVGYLSSEVKFSCSVAYLIETFESRSQNWAELGSKL